MIKLRTREKDEISDPKSDKAWRETIIFIDSQLLESEVSWFGVNKNGERRCQLHRLLYHVKEWTQKHSDYY